MSILPVHRPALYLAWKVSSRRYVEGWAAATQPLEGIDLAALPTRRADVTGIDLDGNQVRLVLSIARKLYVCPGCRHRLEIGEEHVLVKRAEEGRRFHQHWHSDCARAIARELDLARSLRARKP